MKKLLIFLALGSLAACTKDKTKSALDQLPPATQTGANTFGCLVNGVPVYTTYKFSSFAGEGVEYADGVRYYSNIAVYAVTESNNMSVKYEFDLTVDSPVHGRYNVISTYKAYTKRSCNLTIHSNNSSIKSGYYAPIDSNAGYVEINHYVPVSVLSGLFEMILVSSTTDTIHITKGRFDIAH